MPEMRTEQIILGRVIGTATGWDQFDTFGLQLNDFEPAEGVEIPAGDCLAIHFEIGAFDVFNNDGEIIASGDLLSAIKDAKFSQL